MVAVTICSDLDSVVSAFCSEDVLIWWILENYLQTLSFPFAELHHFAFFNVLQKQNFVIFLMLFSKAAILYVLLVRTNE